MSEMTSAVPPDSESDRDRFEVWKEYERVAMHFNDLLMRLRTQSLAAIGAFAGLAGLILKAETGTALRWGTLAGVFGLLIFVWIAVWILDFMYYNRLLRGAVDALLEVESEHQNRRGIPQLILSTRIETAVAGAPRAGYWARSKAWWLFYSVIMAALVAGLVVSGYAVGGVHSAMAALKSYRTPTRPAVTSEVVLTRRELFERKRLCVDLGENRFDKDSKSLGQNMTGIRPTICFSEHLNTCLYSSGYIGNKSSYLMVADLLANKDLVSSVVSDGRVVSGLDGAAFRQKSEELMLKCTP